MRISKCQVKMYDKQNMACYTAMLIFNTRYTLISNLVVCNYDSCLWIKAQICVCSFLFNVIGINEVDRKRVCVIFIVQFQHVFTYKTTHFPNRLVGSLAT